MLVENWEEILIQNRLITQDGVCYWKKNVQGQSSIDIQKMFSIDTRENSRGTFKEYSIPGNYLSLRIL